MCTRNGKHRRRGKGFRRRAVPYRTDLNGPDAPHLAARFLEWYILEGHAGYMVSACLLASFWLFERQQLWLQALHDQHSQLRCSATAPHSSSCCLMLTHTHLHRHCAPAGASRGALQVRQHTQEGPCGTAEGKRTEITASDTRSGQDDSPAVDFQAAQYSHCVPDATASEVRGP